MPGRSGANPREAVPSDEPPGAVDSVSGVGRGLDVALAAMLAVAVLLLPAARLDRLEAGVGDREASSRQPHIGGTTDEDAKEAPAES